MQYTTQPPACSMTTSARQHVDYSAVETHYYRVTTCHCSMPQVCRQHCCTIQATSLV